MKNTMPDTVSIVPNIADIQIAVGFPLANPKICASIAAPIVNCEMPVLK